MKLPVIFLIIISFSKISFGQELAKNGLPLNAKAIILDSDKNYEDLFWITSKVLFDQEYEIKQANKDIGIIQTELKNVKGGWYLRLSLSVSEGFVKILGYTKVLRDDNDQVINYGMKGSLNLMAFDEMSRIANAIPNTGVRYEFQKGF